MLNKQSKNIEADNNSRNFDDFEIAYDQDKYRKKRSLSLRIILILAVLLLVYIAAMLTIELPWVQRLTFRVKEAAYNLVHERDLGEGDFNNDIALSELEDIIPFYVELPQWLPDGVEFYNATYNTYYTGVYEVFLNYIGESSNIHITIIQTNDPNQFESVISSKDCLLEKHTIKNNVVFIQTSTEYTLSSAFYVTDKSISFNVAATLDKQPLVKIIENMD